MVRLFPTIERNEARRGLRGFCRWLGVAGLALSSLACTTGEGDGFVRSDRLFVRECHDGPFDLQPDFFGSNPFEDTQTIRMQRGDLHQETSDGVNILVTDVSKIRADMLGQDIPIGLPRGVTPPGVPIEFNPDPPLVSIALYLNDSCYTQNVSLYSLDGTIRFTSLFSGDTNEEDADARLTEAEFTGRFADPRELTPGNEPEQDPVSVVTGYFRFFFQRGQPAQPFP